MGDRNLSVSGYLAGTQTPGAPDGWAGSVSLDYPNDLWRVDLHHTRIQADFNPEMGFVRRKGIRRTYGSVRFHPRPRISGIRQLFFRIWFDYIHDFDWRLLSRDLEFRLLGAKTQREDRFVLNFRPQFERLDDDFEIVEGVVIPAGTYRFNRWELYLEAGKGRPVSGNAGLGWGEYFTGKRRTWRLDGQVNMGSRFSLGPTYQRNDLLLNATPFSTNELSCRATVTMTTSLSMRMLLQWNDQTDQVNLNFRLSFLPSGGSTFFLVYNQLWEREALGWRASDRAVLLKSVYLLNLWPSRGAVRMAGILSAGLK